MSNSLFPLTVSSRSQSVVAFGAGKRILHNGESITLSASDMTPSLVSTLAALITAGYVSVASAENQTFTASTFSALFSGGNQYRLAAPPGAPIAAFDSLRNCVHAGLRLIAPTTQSTNNSIANHRINIECGTARVAGFWCGHAPASATGYVKADYSCGTNGKKKNGTTAAAVLSAASKGFVVHAVLAVMSDGTLIGPDAANNYPFFIYGDEAVSGSEVALTDAELETAITAYMLTQTAGSQLGGWILLGTFSIRTDADSVISATYNGTISNSRPRL